MPTYQYKCLDCAYQFEQIQKMSDDPLSECPNCGGKLKRLIGAGAGVIFKGSGFYTTDYRSEGYKKEAEKEKKSDSSSAGTAKTKADATATKKVS
jgi:putative FmdB family regulatory protein